MSHFYLRTTQDGTQLPADDRFVQRVGVPACKPGVLQHSRWIEFENLAVMDEDGGVATAGWVPKPTVDPNRPLVPSEEEIAKLPRLARAAFAIRAAATVTVMIFTIFITWYSVSSLPLMFRAPCAAATRWASLY